MNYSKFTIVAKQTGSTNNCQLILDGIEKKDDGALHYIFEAIVHKKDGHFPNVPVFGPLGPFFIDGGTDTVNPILKPLNGHKVMCRVKSDNKLPPTINVSSEWETSNEPLKLPIENGELPSQIIDSITENPVEVVICMDISGSMRQAFKKDDIHSKMEMANHNAIAFIHKLRNDVDFLGICSFSTSAKYVWGEGDKTQLLDNAKSEEAVKAIRHLRSDGGQTYMTKGLKQAGSMLSNSQSSRKTIILLSDGLDSTKAPDEIQKASELKKEGICCPEI